MGGNAARAGLVGEARKIARFWCARFWRAIFEQGFGQELRRQDFKQLYLRDFCEIVACENLLGMLFGKCV